MTRSRVKNDFAVGIDDNATSTRLTLQSDGSVDVANRLDIEGTTSGSYIVCDDGTNGRFQINPTSASEVSLYGATSGFSGWGALNFKGTHHIMTYGPGAGTELARFDLDGLKFNGDTAAANALDDYEEGTWTPRFEALTTDFTTVNYIVQDGFYQKVGNTVHTWFRLRISSYTGSPAGLVVVAGWPFTPSGGVYQAGAVGYTTGWTNSPQNVYTQTNQGYAIMSKDGGAGTSGIQIGDLNASGFNDIIASLNYKV